MKQCRAFKMALQKSVDALLVHNTETDGEWGCGPDLKGRNMMGRILMSIRTRMEDYDREFPPLQTETTDSAPSTSKCPPASSLKLSSHPPSCNKTKSVLVIGNSNARGLSQGIRDRGLDSTAFVYPGQTVSQIQGRLDSIAATNVQPDVVVIHAGDIETRDYKTSTDDISSSLQKLIRSVRTKYASTRIILSGLPRVPGNPRVTERIDRVNLTSEHLCEELSNCVFLSNRNARLQRDRIHFTAQSKDFVARTVARHVKQCL